MAELLVRVVDKINEDLYLDCQCTKRGDVIVAMPDGWAWGKEELSSPQWRIIVMPELSLGDAESFIVPEFNKDPLQPSKTLKKRAFRLDIDSPSLGPEFVGFLADASRSRPSIKLVSDVKDVGLFDVPVTVDIVKDANGNAVKVDGEVQAVTELKPQEAISVPLAEFMALKLEKPVTVDPAVISIDETVIG